jgi:cyclopropane-fatty-acyl-phospholipid synthase
VRSAAAWIADKLARRTVLAIASALQEGELRAHLPGGSIKTFGRSGGDPRATIDIHRDEFFYRVLLGGEVGFGEAYVDGLWDSDDLVALLVLAIENRRTVAFDGRWLALPSRLRDLRIHRTNRNTPDRAKDNIHTHYDLGNEFFRLFLDETMTYSCAYFTSLDISLGDAQREKYHRICLQADLSQDDHVLEIGCGWGGFAMYAAQQYGCRVTCLTISQEQLALTRESISEAGLASLIDVRFCDYRDIEGQYDKIVSIEMFEAVGAEYFEEFFEACDHAMRPGGRMVMQVITVPDRSFEALRDGVNWVQKYIFPGGMLPSIAELERALNRTSLLITYLEDIGDHYATTLHHWRERFLSQIPAVRAMGFDERFVRMWEYYLAASEAGFLTRNTGDLQIAFDKPGVASLPQRAAGEQHLLSVTAAGVST